MTKSKKPKTKKPKAKRPKKTVLPKAPSRTMPQPRKAARMGLHAEICSITDPFCVHAKSAKYPDGKGGGTVTFQIRSLFSWSTFAHGGDVIYASGGLPNFSLGSSSYAAGNYTMSSTYGPRGGNIAAFNAYADHYRIVTWGVVVRNALPALSASGSLIVSKQTSMPPVSSVVASGQLVGTEVEVHPIHSELEVPVIGIPAGNNARTFTAPNSTTTENSAWQCIKLEITGAPADTTTKLTIEFVYNVEFQLNEANIGLHQFITPAVPNKPAVLAASEKVLTTSKTIFADGVEKASSSLLAKVESAAEDILTSGMAWLGL